MAYTLQPGLTLLDKYALPTESAEDTFVVYPQPGGPSGSCSRVSTMEYGTAPYMAGKGAPNHLLMVDDELRPQSTTRFNKVIVTPVHDFLFPMQNLDCIGPAPTLRHDPASSRAILQNAMFSQRYK
jgi:hypothetical protein